MNSRNDTAEEQKERTYRIIFEDSCEPKCIVDCEGIIIDANDAFCERIGKQPELCIGRNIYTILSPENTRKRR